MSHDFIAATGLTLRVAQLAPAKLLFVCITCTCDTNKQVLCNLNFNINDSDLDDNIREGMRMVTREGGDAVTSGARDMYA
jgi:hypothetical protein